MAAAETGREYEGQRIAVDGCSWLYTLSITSWRASMMSTSTDLEAEVVVEYVGLYFFLYEIRP